MKPTLYKWTLALALLAGCADSSTALPSPPDQSSDEPGVWLEAAPCGEHTCVRVDYVPGAAPQPRMAELFVKHGPELRVIGVSAGEATLAASKELTSKPVDNGTTRIVIYSAANVQRIGQGTLATLELEKVSAKARVELVPGKPFFAPAEAMQGLRLGDPVEF